jgi:hypothetical protein
MGRITAGQTEDLLVSPDDPFGVGRMSANRPIRPMDTVRPPVCKRRTGNVSIDDPVLTVSATGP